MLEAMKVEGPLHVVCQCDKCKAESQEPVCPECKAEILYECVACSRNNYPPQRTWVGLTDEEIDAAWVTVAWHSSKGLQELRREYARAIEAKLKEKNNA